MTFKKFLCLTVLLLGMACGMQAQRYVVRKLPTQALLPVFSIHCLLQDSEGFMWYGTNGGGLCRDNGYQVAVWRDDVRTPLRLNDNHVVCIVENLNRQIWFGTHKGLYCIDKATYTLTQPLAMLAKASIDALFADRRGRVWICAKGKILCSDPQGRVLSSCATDRPVSQFYDDGNTLWAVLWQGGVKVLDRRDYINARCRFRSCRWPSEASPICMAKSHASDGYWIGTWGQGICYYEPKANRLTPQSATLGMPAKQQVIDISIDRNQGVLWATTMDNIYAYAISGKSLRSLSTDAFLPAGSKILDHMTQDRNGNLFVAGFVPHSFIVSIDNNQIERHSVASMCQLTGFPLLADRVLADHGGFWIWQGRQGLTYYSPSDNRVTPVAGHAYERCCALRKSNGSGIWAAAGKQIFGLSATGQGVQETFMASTNHNVSCLYDKGDGHLWIGSDKAIYRYATIARQMERVAKTTGNVADIVVSDNQTIFFIVAGKGLWKQKVTLPPVRIDQGGEGFTALALLDGTTLIAATAQGNVYTLSDGAKSLTKEQRMCLANGDMIKDIKTDRMGHVWIMADQYVTEYNPQTHAFRIFRNTNPLVNVAYFYSLEPTSSGMLLNGAGAFCAVGSSAELNRSAGQTSRPVVTSVVAGDSTCLIGQKQSTFRLPHNVQTLTVHLSTLDILHAGEITYAYRLKGLGDQWVRLPQGVNAITLSALPKGTFQLEAKATDRHGCWGAEWACLTIECPPRWYETWWAWLLFAVAAVGLVVGLWQLRRRIRWLETLQRKRKELSLTEISIKPEETNKARIDEQFLRQAISCVESHLADTEFNVERFAEVMCMSRMNLYRKMMEQTGLTPSVFIQDIRLKKAASLLDNGPKMPVAEVASRVGFSSSGYFSKCFKKKFGVLPTEYVGRKAANT